MLEERSDVLLHHTRIAHLSDVHMLEPRPGRSGARYDLSTRFVSLGRKLDARCRAKKLTRAFSAAAHAGASHFVLSGDLTEMGTAGEFEAFAEVLHDTKIAPSRITLVPGNHDAYSGPGAWKRALEGPLAAFAETSATEAGRVVDRGDLAYLPLDVALHQPVTRSSGELRADAADALERRLDDPALRRKVVVLVQHHPPYPHDTGVWQWIDGLRGWGRLMDLLHRFPNVHVLHGHLHYAIDRIVKLGRSRIFGAPAIVDDAHDRSRVRLYELHDGALQSAGILEL
jgi:3',5'-cyclic AMP phosphodiesterase CpdA